MKTRRIGEQFNFEGVKLEVVEVKRNDAPCFKCYFNLKRDCISEKRRDIAGSCVASTRKDLKEVYFKEV